MQNMFLIINQYFTALTNTYLMFICKLIYGEFGQIYVNNNYCDISSLGFHISVSIASNDKQIKFLQTSKIIDLIFKPIISFH